MKKIAFVSIIFVFLAEVHLTSFLMIFRMNVPNLL